jgi:hypothetical protein
MNYEDWVEIAENNLRSTLAPSPQQTNRAAWEIDRAYWKGYLDAARDAARFMEKGKSK